jgi:hypothetical protein
MHRSCPNERQHDCKKDLAEALGRCVAGRSIDKTYNVGIVCDDCSRKAQPELDRTEETVHFERRLTFDLSGPPKAGPLEGRVSALVGLGQRRVAREIEFVFGVNRCILRRTDHSVPGFATVQAPAADALAEALAGHAPTAGEAGRAADSA